MLLSELLAELHDVQDEHGDREVMLFCGTGEELSDANQVRVIKYSENYNEEVDLDEDGELCIEISSQ